MAEQMPKLKRYSAGSVGGLLYDEHKRPGSRYVRACGAPLVVQWYLSRPGQGSRSDVRNKHSGRLGQPSRRK